MSDQFTIQAAMARAQRYAAEARAEAEDDLARIRRENPDFAKLADDLRQLCGGRVTYLHEYATGKTWGTPSPPGIPASVPIKHKRRRSGGR